MGSHDREQPFLSAGRLVPCQNASAQPSKKNPQFKCEISWFLNMDKFNLQKITTQQTQENHLQWALAHAPLSGYLCPLLRLISLMWFHFSQGSRKGSIIISDACMKNPWRLREDARPSQKCTCSQAEGLDSTWSKAGLPWTPPHWSVCPAVQFAGERAVLWFTVVPFLMKISPSIGRVID